MPTLVVAVTVALAVTVGLAVVETTLGVLDIVGVFDTIFAAGVVELLTTGSTSLHLVFVLVPYQYPIAPNTIPDKITNTIAIPTPLLCLTFGTISFSISSFSSSDILLSLFILFIL